MAFLNLLANTDSTATNYGSLFLPTCLVVVLIYFLAGFNQAPQDGKTPPSIPESFPGLGNGYSFIFQNMKFLDYVIKKFPGQNILKFRIGPNGFYIINEAKNAHAVVRQAGHFSSDKLILMSMKQLDSVSAKDMKKFEMDKSGRSHIPSVEIAEETRLWAPLHRLFLDYIANKTAVENMTSKFCELFSESLEKQPKGQWATVQLYTFLQAEIAESAITALAGREILKQNPGFVEALWNFDKNIFPMLLGVPRLIYGRAYAARDAFHEMGEKWLKSVWEKYDWNSPNLDWEPLFGSRYVRVHSKFLRERDFDLRSQAGLLLGAIWASNANSIPMTAWFIIHLIQDKTLFQQVRDAAMTACTIDPTTGEKRLDVKKLGEIPLFQSIYAETLRMHVSINVTREVTEDMKLDGYALKKGYLVQTPSYIAHFDKSIWKDENHPAEEFWAERHIIYTDKIDSEGVPTRVASFSMDGRTGGYFPYGGGISMCPGRHFAKQEMITAAALLIINFDIELLEYVNSDGSKSDRPPKDDPSYCGTAAMPPDRDLKIRWKRL